MRKVKRYIPENSLKWLNNQNYKNKDHLVIILDMITRVSIFRGTTKNEWGESDWSHKFIDIPHSYFINIISNRNSFTEAMKYLQDNQIILCDGIYSKQLGKCYGYKFNENIVSKLTTYILEKDLISKKIAKNKNSRNNSVPQWLKSNKSHFLNNFKIHYTEAINYIDKLYSEQSERLEPSDTSGRLRLLNQYNAYYMSISSINDRDLFFRRNNNNGRIDSNLTNLKKELRQFINYSEPLYQIDIVNSQPLFLACLIKTYQEQTPLGVSSSLKEINDINSLLNNLNIFKTSAANASKSKQNSNSRLSSISYVVQNENSKSINTYMDVVCRGFLYDQIIGVFKTYKSKNITRKEAKIKFFQVLYSDNKSFKHEKLFLRRLFPIIIDFLEELKRVDYKIAARILQSMESSFVIDTIIPLFEIHNINCFTIHDSWVMRHSDILAATSIIENEFIRLYGTKPKLEITPI